MATEAFYKASLKTQVQYEDVSGIKKKKTYTQSNMKSGTADLYDGLAQAAQNCRPVSIGLIGVKREEQYLITEVSR